MPPFYLFLIFQVVFLPLPPAPAKSERCWGAVRGQSSSPAPRALTLRQFSALFRRGISDYEGFSDARYNATHLSLVIKRWVTPGWPPPSNFSFSELSVRGEEAPLGNSITHHGALFLQLIALLSRCSSADRGSHRPGRRSPALRSRAIY